MRLLIDNAVLLNCDLYIFRKEHKKCEVKPYKIVARSAFTSDTYASYIPVAEFDDDRSASEFMRRLAHRCSGDDVYTVDDLKHI